ncbi:T4 beta protein [Kribbella sp. VKM Ac-2571]|uniref:beta family protein n=1 Tax=Kribbella sp. VKM Ac-2571 TaxID=2512222 RepID=UPI00105DC917|nr:hypothetical protein [Kribbella sp. VKM Ac-2571]TDO59060.1 T4 beta protein [Kribbella sp. VKM Ac-2571]
MAPAGDFRTLIALRAKKGELAALQELGEDHSVQPLLALDVGPVTSVDGLLDRVEEVVRQLWSFGRMTMLDATNTSTDARRGAAVVLEDLHRRLNTPTTLLQAESVPFVPVIDAGTERPQVAGIGRLVQEMGQGCAVRVQVRTTAADDVLLLLDDLQVDPSDLDLVADAGYVAGPDPFLVDDVLHVLESIQRHGGFRSITMLSGSVPKSLDQLHRWEQPRFEESVWQSVNSEAGGGVRFGDYGATHPVSGDGWPPKHISLRYSCADHWLYLRERVLEPAEETSRARTVRFVSSQLVTSGSFSGPDYSWGDGQLALAAGGGGRALGDLSKPVAFATSHHLAYLSEFAAA